MELLNNDALLPAEWYPQSGMQLTWPHAATDWAPYLDEITLTFVQFAEAIASREPLLIATSVPRQTESTLSHALSAEAFANVRIVACPTHDTWARDHGGLSLIGVEDTICDFKFNGWGEKFEWEADNAITRHLYDAGVFNGRLVSFDFVLEGGSVESDGRGTIFTTSTCLLADHRNQPMTQQQIEDTLKSTLHAHRIVWLDYGHVVGDDTDGHIDTIVRVAPDDTLLYMRVDDDTDEMYDDFKLLESQLMGLQTMEGKPYRLLPLPTPRPIFYDGERLPATYANFVVVNGAVIVPTYRQPDLDKKAMAIIGQAFPDREIIGLDATVVIRQHGSLHCLTMQFPKGVLRN